MINDQQNGLGKGTAVRQTIGVEAPCLGAGGGGFRFMLQNGGGT